jgi:hypothetical protein
VTATTDSSTPFRRAASTSTRWKPKVCRSVAGRAATNEATSATSSPMASLDMCPASASSASEPESTAPAISATRTATTMASAIARRVRLPAAALP